MPQPITEGFPLSPQQKCLWDAQGEAEYRVSRVAISIGQPVDLERLNDAVRRLAAANEILRTTFRRSPGMKVPFQVVNAAAADTLTTEVAANQLVLTLPALCADAAGLRNIASEFRAFYENPGYEPAESLQYADYSEWQNQTLKSDDTAAVAGRLFWEKRDFSGIPSLKLPFERSARGAAGDPVTIAIPAGTSATEALAGWQTLLWRLTGQTEVVVGRVVSGRNHEEFAGAIGLFEKVIPEYAILGPEADFRAAVTALNRSIEEASVYEDYFPVDAAALPSIGFLIEEPAEGVETSANAHGFKLALHYGGPAGSWLTYDAAAFDRVSVETIAARFCLLLNRSEIIGEAEKRQVVTEWNQTSAEYPRTATIHRLFEDQTLRTPDRDALRCGKQVLTYAELNARANRIARYLRERGVKPNTCVALFVERSAEMIVGLLAILKAGGCYVPLVTDHPKARLAHQLAETAAPVILTQEKLKSSLPEFSGEVVCLDSETAPFTEHWGTNPEPAGTVDDLVYVIYTSGSTGTPKGVAVRHRNLVNYSWFIAEKLKLAERPEGLHFATVSTIAADLGNTAIFPSLISGGCLHVIEYETALSPALFADYMAAWPVDVLKITPTHLSSLLDGAAGAPILPRTHLFTGGEALRWELLKRVSDAADCAVINHYGPTEAAVGCCTFEPAASDVSQWSPATVPVGRPIANTQVFILDAQLQPLPVGVAGELCVAGDGLAQGYLNQPQQTADRFVALPWLDAGARAYRTGDLARFLPTGDIEFLGRIDQQVKIRGFRVEPAEIVSALKAHPQVREAVVIPDAGDAGERRLIACVVAPKTLKEGDLRAFLRQELPEYMIPAGFVIADAIPFTANGKVDSAVVVRALAEQGRTEREFIGPRTPEEEKLAAMWMEVLRVDRVGMTDNFFELGGHSLMATQVISRVRSVFRVQLPLIAFLETPTIGDLAAKLATCPPLEDEEDEMARLLRELDGISEEEAEALLAGENESGPTPRA